MSAELLRGAATLMRKRANAATQAEFWYADFAPDGKGSFNGEWIVDSEPSFICSTHDDSDRCLADAEHIASWHPVVALAVADWLDAVAGKAEQNPNNNTRLRGALTVALAYLGEVTPRA